MAPYCIALLYVSIQLGTELVLPCGAISRMARVVLHADDKSAQPAATAEAPVAAAHGPTDGVSTKDRQTGALHEGEAFPNTGGNPTGTLQSV